jgi:NAD(P)-dependent dehydrogenase (short-subunit alcohol dehydrogenase family)
MIHPNRFAGKVAVVTGAAQGIGREVALRIAREGGGVAMSTDRNWWRRLVTKPRPPALRQSRASPIWRPLPVQRLP